MNAPHSTAVGTDRLLRAVTAANPAPEAELTAAESSSAAALLARIEATPRGAAARSDAATRKAAPRRRRFLGSVRSRLATAGAVALALAGAAILAPSTASAEALLLEAADGAALQPEATGQYWYVHWQLYTTEELSETVKEGTPYAFDREIWLSRDGGILRDGTAAAIGAAATGHLNPDDLRFEAIPGPTSFGDEAQFTWDELIALPTDPKALRAVLEAKILKHTDEATDYRVYRAASGLLVETPAPPQLRRALWQVLSTLPELTLGDPTTDGLGRPGALVIADFTHARERVGIYQWVVDQKTGTVLEVRWLSPDNTAVAGKKTLVEQGPRDAAPTAQPPRCGTGSVPYTAC